MKRLDREIDHTRPIFIFPVSFTFLVIGIVIERRGRFFVASHREPEW
jgi:hypothetical protein